MPDGTTWLTAHRIYFAAAFAVPVRSAAGASCARGPTPPLTPDGQQPPADARIDRRTSRPRGGSICVEVTWLGEQDAAQRDLADQQLAELIEHLVIAPDPDDPATWFDADDVLPERQPR